MKLAAMVWGLVLLGSYGAGAQHFLAVGVGVSGTFFKSGDLDLFKRTYNSVNSEGLSQPLSGIGNGAVGVRLELGYRHWGKFSAALIGGWTRTTIRDAAVFGNGEERQLEYRLNSFFVESEAGIVRKPYYLAGLITLFVNRQFVIDSEYRGPADQAPLKALSGRYEAAGTFSADLGLAAGLYRDPIFLTLKVSYPVYTGGESEVFRDDNPQKVAEGLDAFPRNFVEYTNRPQYPGVRSDVDGLKILLTTEFALRLRQ